MSFEGSCHCGAVTFTVEGELPTTAISCNCSHCRRKSLLLSFAPRSEFTLNSGAEVLDAYLFNKHKIEHRFCRTCGTEPFAYGVSPDGSETSAINLRCVPSADLDALELHRFDGARL